MAISTPCYCTREDVKGALDLKETARDNTMVDHAIEAASRSIESQMNRVFYPSDGTKKFDWPNYQRARPWRLWLNQNDLVSLTSVTSGGTSIPVGQVFLEPVNSAPPYTYIELDLSTTATFSVGPTFQRSIALTGTWGYSANTTSAGTLAAAVNSTTATTITVSDATQMGIGDIILIDSERMLIQERTTVDSGTINMVGVTTASMADNEILGNAAVLHVGEVLLIDSEKMLITDISGNITTVKRAWDGSTLAVHSSLVTLYVYRVLTVLRGQLGTTAATHLNAAPISRFVYPSLVNELAVAEAENTVLQKTSGYARTVGEGDSERPISGAGLRDIRMQARGVYGRKARQRAV